MSKGYLLPFTRFSICALKSTPDSVLCVFSGMDDQRICDDLVRGSMGCCPSNSATVVCCTHMPVLRSTPARLPLCAAMAHLLPMVHLPKLPAYCSALIRSYAVISIVVFCQLIRVHNVGGFPSSNKRQIRGPTAGECCVVTALWYCCSIICAPSSLHQPMHRAAGRPLALTPSQVHSVLGAAALYGGVMVILTNFVAFCILLRKTTARSGAGFRLAACACCMPS